MGDPLILNGLLAQSYPNPFMVFPQLFSMTIYMFLVVFILIREGMVLISHNFAIIWHNFCGIKFPRYYLTGILTGILYIYKNGLLTYFRRYQSDLNRLVTFGRVSYLKRILFHRSFLIKSL